MDDVQVMDDLLLEAAVDMRKLPTVSILAYTGGIMKVPTWGDVVIDLANLDASGGVAILSDHDGYPRSICRHPNDQPRFGYMGTVCSLIMEPAEGRMHISRGNPCTNGYATHTLS
mgnify:CR=1 FL=1